MVQELNNEQLKAMLDDTQASLAAALARIEGFRLREKQLMNELSQLRQQVHGGTPPPAPAVDETASAQGQAAPQPAEASPAEQPQQQQEPWTSPVGAPVYLSYLEGEYPVHVLASGRKIPGSLVVTKEHLDFVEVKARIRSEEFIGITTHRMSAAPKAGGEADGTSTSGQDVSGQGTGAWQILWRKGDVPQRLVFEASKGTRENLHRHTERWLGTVASEPNGPIGAQEGESELAVPRNLVVGDLSMSLVGEPSQILAPEHVRALASVLPPLERMREWTNTYSTARHGISLATMYRKVLPHSPSLLVIKDFGGHVFGSYTPESWRVAPRFYGSGETFVFQLEPYKVMYPWRAGSKTKNDFFQYGTPECIAVGGGGHFAIWVDGELLHGSSGTCSTFGSPCLATKEDFTVHMVEIWQIVTGSTGGGH